MVDYDHDMGKKQYRSFSGIFSWEQAFPPKPKELSEEYAKTVGDTRH